jgi:hypothetical protein
MGLKVVQPLSLLGAHHIKYNKPNSSLQWSGERSSLLRASVQVRVLMESVLRAAAQPGAPPAVVTVMGDFNSSASSALYQ